MISVYCWNVSTRAGEWHDLELLKAQPDELRTYPGVIWIDLNQPTEEEEQLVFQQFYTVHALTLEDITRLRREPDEPHLPKVEEFPDYLFVVANPLAPEVLAAVAKTAQRIAKAVMAELEPVGVNLLQANGAGAGQSVPHLHIHIMPRRANDGLVLNWSPKAGDKGEIEAICERLKAALRHA